MQDHGEDAVNPFADSARATRSDDVKLLALEGGLADGLDDQARAEAQTVVWARSIRVAVGLWDAPSAPERFGGWLGLVLLDGVLARHVEIGAMGWTELLAPGDLVRPWTHASETASSLPAHGRYEVVEPAWLAVLDRDFAVRVARWPEITAALVGRVVERSRLLTYQLAAGRPAQIEVRVWMTLWHLADRFGRVTSDGVELRMPHLTHDSLAVMLGARRPTVTSALGRLVDRGLVTQVRRGVWILHGDPQAGLGSGAHPASPLDDAASRL